MKIYGFMPIRAMAKFSMTAPYNWDDMTKESQDAYFADNASRDASLCRQCIKDMPTDYEVDLEAIEENEIDWWEE